MRVILGVAFIILTTGCKDKAEEPFAACQASEAKSDWADALQKCNLAATVDPSSKSGLAAGAKLDELRSKIAAKKKADDEEAAKAETARKIAQAAEDAKCPMWTTICTLGRFPDGSEQTTGIQRFDTRAKCESIGKEMGGIPCDPCRCKN